MTRHSLRLLRYVARLTLAAMLLSGLQMHDLSAQGRQGQNAASRLDVPAWPTPPSPARIRFLRALDPLAVRRRPSVLSKLATLVVGRETPPAMAQPYGVAVGADRRVYVADTLGGVIHVYDLEKPGYSALRIAAQSLVGIAVVGNRIYVTDSTAGRLLCLDLKGHVLWTRGTKEGFVRPTGLVASSDRLFVVDTLQHRVVVVSLTGDVLGGFGTRGNGPGQFNFPTNIARTPEGHLLVTDSMNFRVQVFDREGTYERAFGHLGDGWGNFNKPKGVAVDSNGHIYVVEGLNDVVQVFDDEGRLLLVFGGSGTGIGQFWLPSGIAIVNDVVYVADAANRRVQMFEYVKERR